MNTQAQNNRSMRSIRTNIVLGAAAFSLVFMSSSVSGCSSLEYRNESNIDYSIYKTAYVDRLNNATIDFDLVGYEEEMTEFFVRELEPKAGLEEISYFPQPKDTTKTYDLDIQVVVLNLDWRTFEDDEGRDNYKAEVRVECIVNDANGIELFRFRETEEKVQELANYSGTFEEVDRGALRSALETVSRFFLKDFSI